MFKQLLFILFFLLFSTCTYAIAIQPASQNRAQTIPLEISESGHIFLRVRVNGSEPRWFGLDTGFEQSAISTKQAKELNLKLYGETQTTGGGENTEDFSFTKDVSLDVSGANFKLKEVGVLALDFIAPIAGEPVVGILGYDFMSRFVVEIDYANKVINLYNPQSYRYRGRGDILPIKMVDNYPAIPATVTLPGLKPVAAMFEIDTGAGNDIFFYSPFIKRHKLLDSKQETTEAGTLGIGGTIKIRIGRADNIRLGRTVIANPSVHFSQATKGDSASTFSAGHIGNGIFRQFKKVIFDQMRRRLILESNTQTQRNSRTPEYNIDSGKQALKIPIEITERNHIFVSVRINDSEPLRFIVDSGSPSSLLSKHLIERLNLRVKAFGEASGAGEGADEVALVGGVTIKLPGVTLFNQEVPAIDFKSLEASLGQKIDGMIGYDFMRRFVFEVDYAARFINIYDAATYRYRGKGQSFPITTEDDHPHIQMTVTLPKRQPLTGKFIVDGGAGAATMEFSSPFVKKYNLLKTVEITETKTLAGIGGSITIGYGRGKNIRLGRFQIENPIVGFSQNKKGALANPNIAGLIGSKFLRRFTVIYDDRRRRIIFEPNDNFAQPE